MNNTAANPLLDNGEDVVQQVLCLQVVPPEVVVGLLDVVLGLVDIPGSVHGRSREAAFCLVV